MQNGAKGIENLLVTTYGVNKKLLKCTNPKEHFPCLFYLRINQIDYSLRSVFKRMNYETEVTLPKLAPMSHHCQN
jgi:hypothetical protein